MSVAAYEMPVKNLTLIPAVDLTAARYKFVFLDANGNGVLATAGGLTIGVLQEPNDVDQPARVMFSGISFIYLDGVVPNGSPVEVGANGKAKAHVVGTSTGTIVGIAVVGGSDAAGTIGSVLIK
jgi:hypothetical protein